MGPSTASVLFSTAILLLLSTANAQPPAPGGSDMYCRSLGITNPGDLKCCVSVVDFRTSPTTSTRLSGDVCHYCLSVGICPQGNTDFTKVNAKGDHCEAGGKWEKVSQRASLQRQNLPTPSALANLDFRTTAARAFSGASRRVTLCALLSSRCPRWLGSSSSAQASGGVYAGASVCACRPRSISSS